MARMLGRSKSLRILKGGHKETHQQDDSKPAPPPAISQIEIDTLKADAPVTATDRRVETPDMLQRPKTSGGVGDRSQQFHRKAAPANLHSDDQSFKFPFPSPNHSSTRILYTAEVHEDREGVIGIALGSPTMNPNWDLTPQTTNFVNDSASTVTQISSNAALPAPIDAPREASKPKISRWKSIFGKKSQPQERRITKFYQLTQSVASARQNSHHDHESLDSRVASQAANSRDEVRAASPPTFKPEIRESRKRPKGEEQPSMATRPRALTNSSNKSKTSLLRPASSPKPLPKEHQNDRPTVPQLTISGDLQDGAQKSNGDIPLLDVDIPDIKMERYSVMFGNLLQQPANRSSSLLVRRQGSSERLKPLNLSVKNEGRDKNLKPQRRATSPNHRPKSPSAALSLFPQPRTQTPSPRAIANSVNRPRPLQRSKTAPATSPNRQTFSLPLPDSPTKNNSKQTSRGESPRDSTFTSENPHQKSQLFTLTPLTQGSFESSTAESPIIGSGRVVGPAWKPQVKEPEWEIVSKPSQRTALSSHPAHAPLDAGPSSAPLEPSSRIVKPQTDDKTAPRSADQTTTTSNSLVLPKPKPKPQSPNAGGSQATTIGIARSVSVSRASPRSADLLKPTLVRRGTERSPSRSPGAELFVDRKPLTPTLVELGNRRSQRVQLVDAEA